MKALDIVRTKNGTIGMVTETGYGGNEVSVCWFLGQPHREKTAWWSKEELEKIDSLPRLLAFELSHPFGGGKKDAALFFAD